MANREQVKGVYISSLGEEVYNCPDTADDPGWGEFMAQRYFDGVRPERCSALYCTSTDTTMHGAHVFKRDQTDLSKCYIVFACAYHNNPNNFNNRNDCYPLLGTTTMLEISRRG